MVLREWSNRVDRVVDLVVGKICFPCSLAAAAAVELEAPGHARDLVFSTR